MIDSGLSSPVESVPAGTTLLVTGPSESCTRTIATTMLAAGYPEEGSIYISLADSEATVRSEFETVLNVTIGDQLGVVDCTPSNPPHSSPAVTTAVSSPADQTGIAMAFFHQLDQLREDGYTPIRVAIHSLSSMLSVADLRSIERFLTVITRTVEEHAGVGVVTLDRQVDDEPVEQLRPVFSGVVEFRPTETSHEFRVTGLPNVPEEWVSSK